MEKGAHATTFLFGFSYDVPELAPYLEVDNLRRVQRERALKSAIVIRSFSNS
jgi:hypothetical protein